MAIRGRPPKEQKRHRNPLVYGTVEVPDVPFTGPVPIKAQRSDHPNTKAWLKVVSRLPHAILWQDADWAYIAETMRIKDAFEKGDLKLEAGLRRRYATIGMTYEDRLKLRIRYKPLLELVADLDDHEPAEATGTDRRARIRPVTD